MSQDFIFKTPQSQEYSRFKTDVHTRGGVPSYQSADYVQMNQLSTGSLTRNTGDRPFESIRTIQNNLPYNRLGGRKRTAHDRGDTITSFSPEIKRFNFDDPLVGRALPKSNKELAAGVGWKYQKMALHRPINELEPSAMARLIEEGIDRVRNRVRGETFQSKPYSPTQSVSSISSLKPYSPTQSITSLTEEEIGGAKPPDERQRIAAGRISRKYTKRHRPNTGVLPPDILANRIRSKLINTAEFFRHTKDAERGGFPIPVSHPAGLPFSALEPPIGPIEEAKLPRPRETFLRKDFPRGPLQNPKTSLGPLFQLHQNVEDIALAPELEQDIKTARQIEIEEKETSDRTRLINKFGRLLYPGNNNVIKSLKAPSTELIRDKPFIEPTSSLTDLASQQLKRRNVLQGQFGIPQIESMSLNAGIMQSIEDDRTLTKEEVKELMTKPSKTGAIIDRRKAIAAKRISNKYKNLRAKNAARKMPRDLIEENILDPTVANLPYTPTQSMGSINRGDFPYSPTQSMRSITSSQGDKPYSPTQSLQSLQSLRNLGSVGAPPPLEEHINQFKGAFERPRSDAFNRPIRPSPLTSTTSMASINEPPPPPQESTSPLSSIAKPQSLRDYENQIPQFKPPPPEWNRPIHAYDPSGTTESLPYGNRKRGTFLKPNMGSINPLLPLTEEPKLPTPTTSFKGVNIANIFDSVNPTTPQRGPLPPHLIRKEGSKYLRTPRELRPIETTTSTSETTPPSEESLRKRFRDLQDAPSRLKSFKPSDQPRDEESLVFRANVLKKQPQIELTDADRSIIARGPQKSIKIGENPEFDDPKDRMLKHHRDYLKDFKPDEGFLRAERLRTNLLQEQTKNKPKPTDKKPTTPVTSASGLDVPLPTDSWEKSLDTILSYESTPHASATGQSGPTVSLPRFTPPKANAETPAPSISQTRQIPDRPSTSQQFGERPSEEHLQTLRSQLAEEGSLGPPSPSKSLPSLRREDHIGPTALPTIIEEPGFKPNQSVPASAKLSKPKKSVTFGGVEERLITPRQGRAQTSITDSESNRRLRNLEKRTGHKFGSILEEELGQPMDIGITPPGITPSSLPAGHPRPRPSPSASIESMDVEGSGFKPHASAPPATRIGSFTKTRDPETQSTHSSIESVQRAMDKGGRIAPGTTPKVIQSISSSGSRQSLIDKGLIRDPQGSVKTGSSLGSLVDKLKEADLDPDLSKKIDEEFDKAELKPEQPPDTSNFPQMSINDINDNNRNTDPANLAASAQQMPDYSDWLTKSSQQASEVLHRAYKTQKSNPYSIK